MVNKQNFIHYLFLIVFLTIISSCQNQKMYQAPYDLKISEGFTNPIGFHDQTPTFSWKLPVTKNIKSQSSYRIVVASSPSLLPNEPDLWDSKEVKSDKSIWVKYEGPALQSRQKVYWQIMFSDQAGNSSAWSEIADLELGLLNNSDWQAKWISLEPEAKPDISDKGLIIHRPEYLRRNFVVKDEVEQARLYISAKGLFEAQLNGKKVGEDVLVPGFTPYKKRIETLSYDATELLQNDKNTLAILLGEGWYSGRLAWSKNYWIKKPRPQAICQLEITYKNGKKETILSDDEWRGTRSGPILSSEIYDGEVYDANFEIPNWSAPDFDDSNWEKVKTAILDSDVQLAPKSHQAVRNKIELPTIEITNDDSGRYIFDLGQNMVGVMDLKIPVIKDQVVTIRFAEMLNPDGSMYTENYRNAESTDYYTPKDDGTISYRPKFTFHGFRYVELTGFDESKQPDKSWVTGIVQHSDFNQTGKFNSSHDKLNKLQQNITWGLRGNLLDIPTDCPQRDERLGWTGDVQVIAPTSMFNSNLHAFWSSWLKSVREEQANDGSIPYVVPNVLVKNVSTGWADVATILPWEIYFRTGDIKVLEDNYDMMKGLLAYYKSNSQNHIVDVYTFGDWLQPYPNEDERRGDTPKELIGTAYYARSVDLTMKTAEVLGRTQDVSRLRALRDSIRTTFETTFIDSQGKLTTKYETQTGYLMALGFDLVTAETAQKVLPHLIRKIGDADNHLRTGFLGTPLLPTVLDKYGFTDLMYTILFKETYPSWFYSINQGATTMWERWNSYSHKDGFGDASMNSFNHYAYGAIGQWMYERIAGIKPLKPGYKEIEIAPLPGGPLTSAEASYNTPYGKVSSAWKIKNGVFELKATVPPNTKAKIVIPANTDESLILNSNVYSDNLNVKLLKKNTGNFELTVRPGSYVFESKLNDSILN